MVNYIYNLVKFFKCSLLSHTFSEMNEEYMHKHMLNIVYGTLENNIFKIVTLENIGEPMFMNR